MVTENIFPNTILLTMQAYAKASATKRMGPPMKRCMSFCLNALAKWEMDANAAGEPMTGSGNASGQTSSLSRRLPSAL